jgi:hypothetical protein
VRFANKMSFTLVAGMVNTSAVEEYGGNGVKGGGRVYKATLVVVCSTEVDHHEDIHTSRQRVVQRVW